MSVKTSPSGGGRDGETQITSGVTAGDKVLERVVKFTGAPGGAGGGLFGGTGSGGGGFASAAPVASAAAAASAGAVASRRRRRLRRWRRMSRTVDAPIPRRGRRTSAVIELDRVTKVYRTGRHRRAALRGVSLHHRQRRVRRHHRALGIGQVDADAHPRLPRRADRRARSAWPARTSAP